MSSRGADIALWREPGCGQCIATTDEAFHAEHSLGLLDCPPESSLRRCIVLIGGSRRLGAVALAPSFKFHGLVAPGF